MQTQDTSAEFLFKLWPWFEANKNRLIGAGAAVLVLVSIVYFISSQKSQTEVAAGEAVTSVIVSATPGNTSQLAGDFEQVAEKYAGTDAGRRAELQAAGALFAAGNYANAQTLFQKYLDANSANPLAATAQLGIAASYEAQNMPDQAAAAYQKVISDYPDSPIVPMAQLSLGRVNEQQNKLTDALSHYEAASSSPFGGSIAQEAMIRATEIKGRIAAATPKAAAAATPAPAAASAFTPMSIQQPATK